MKELIELLIIVIGGGLTQVILFGAYYIHNIPHQEWEEMKSKRLTKEETDAILEKLKR